MNIKLANLNDLNEITELHCLSFKPKNHVPMMLGENYVKATYKWLITSKESYVLIGIEGGKIIGLVAVCDGAFTKPMFIACLPEFMLSIVLKPTRLFSKMLWERLLRRPDVDSNKISIIDSQGFAQMTIGAVDSNYRGSGIFGELIEETKNVSKYRGSRGIRAGVYKKNKSSRRVFEKSGWREMKYLETKETVYYTSFFDEEFKNEMMNL
ncbi:Acetyltransferase (GNAT) family protein [Lutibacter agarilyticus]|uniref:Acetyltransferase (GNAT) family protein n=1 Tax=Lutibacter agarilyticus TaxID=1109740 RepID=A0A238YUX7_9FLAO|nr:GNAT family N-acetyltransferase [Lutibacter agarilyticus]SNR74598.1 Acetyltransferase (GNAT) family protein [Lutibacter agarilyticus]